ncbi:hypothetical protein [Saccharothrix sp.]|uniref:hypothetical protein n=1 Tax=Saccharothrix sp. TaxID=1873460 RepID=UPI0028122DAE|nr:hypothetical protein [Saccharothrix sp.]
MTAREPDHSRNTLHRRKSPDWSKTHYVQGHLLNDHLGGPGLEYNLVPLTSQANEVHESTVEHFVKQKFLAMRVEQQHIAAGRTVANPIASISYKVVPTWPVTRRPNTTLWLKAKADLATILAAVRSAAPPAYDPATTKWDDFALDVVQGRAPAYARLIDAADWQLLGQVTAALQNIMEFMTLDTMETRVAHVADLWEFEDAHVPTGLTCSYETTRQDGAKDQDGKLNTWVPNLVDQMALNHPVDVWTP